MSDTCAKCKAELPPGAKFCLQCGTPVPQASQQASTACSSCGTDLPADAKFCSHCGEPVRQDLHPVAIQSFLEAVQNGDLLAVEKMLRADKRYARVRDSTVNRDTPMHYAAKVDQNPGKMMQLLVLYGAEVDVTNDKERNTPLHYMVSFTTSPFDEYVDTSGMSVLLEHGANPNAQDAEGKTPLHLANHGRPDCISKLCHWGADPTIKNNEGLSPLDEEEKYLADSEAEDLSNEEKNEGYSEEFRAQLKAARDLVTMNSVHHRLHLERLEVLRKYAGKRRK